LLAADPVPSPFLRGFAWQVGRPLHVSAMAEAAAMLRGKHDFTAFCAAPGRGRDPVCHVRAVRVVERQHRIGVLISADAFLHYMVRNIVGTLVEVGLGRRPSAWVGDVLAGRDRKVAGPTGPPDGLYLLRVLYPWAVFPGGRHVRSGGARRPVRRP